MKKHWYKQISIILAALASFRMGIIGPSKASSTMLSGTECDFSTAETRTV